MAEQSKSTWAQLKTAALRAKDKADKLQAQGTAVAREVITTAEVVGASYASGFVNERWGERDATTGQKVLKLGNVPASLVGSAALKGAAFFDVFGEFSRDAMAVGSGLAASWSSDTGRASAIAFADRSAKRDEQVQAETYERQRRAA